MESASYEIVKQTRKSKKRPKEKQTNAVFKQSGVKRNDVKSYEVKSDVTRKSVKSSVLKKPNVVLRGAGSWAVEQKSKRIKTSVNKAESWSGPLVIVFECFKSCAVT